MAAEKSGEAIAQSSEQVFEKVVFVDTNCFIQVRDLKDLPWSDIFPGIKKLIILLASVVIEELDKLKSNRDGRLRDRARLALGLIETASSHINFEVEIKSSPVKIILKIEQPAATDWTSLPLLDRYRPDDRLVASVVGSKMDAVLLSHDVGPVVRARLVGKEAIRVPTGWLLPDGSDNAQRELQKALKELDILRSTKPRIEASFSAPHKLICPRLEPLSARVQDLMNTYVRSSKPKKELFSHAPIGGGFSMNVMRQSDIDRYDGDYEIFEQNMRQYISNLHLIVERAGNVRRASLRIKNESNTTAEHLIIEYKIFGRGAFFADRDDAHKHIRLPMVPEPPEPPRSIIDHTTSVSFVPPFTRLKDEQSPVGFYWLHRPAPGEKSSAVQCAEFRPKRDWEDSLLIMPMSSSKESIEVTAAISASNLPEPLHLKVNFECETQDCDWTDALALEMLPKWMQDFFERQV